MKDEDNWDQIDIPPVFQALVDHYSDRDDVRRVWCDETIDIHFRVYTRVGMKLHVKKRESSWSPYFHQKIWQVTLRWARTAAALMGLSAGKVFFTGLLPSFSGSLQALQVTTSNAWRSGAWMSTQVLALCLIMASPAPCRVAGAKG